MQSKPGAPPPYPIPSPNAPPPMNIASARTLDAVIKRGAARSPTALGPRDRMWPHVPWQFHAAFIVFVGLVIFIAYSNSFRPKDRPLAGVNWTLDNKYIIELDPRTKADASVFRPSTWNDAQGRPDFLDIWTRDYWWPKGISGLYRPVVTFTYWLNWRKMSDDETKLDPNLSPAARHAATESIVTNRLLVFHIINYWAHYLVTVLVYLLALHLTKRFWTAAAIGLLFGVHPVGVESVTNIIGRADIFASINVVGGLLLYIRATMSRGLWKVPWLVALGLLTTVGVFSKESAIAVIAAVALYDSIFRVPWRRLFWFPRHVIIDSIKLGLRLALSVALGVSFMSVVINGMLPMMPNWFTPPAPGAPPGTLPTMNWRWPLMLVFAVVSFVSLVVMMAMLPYGRRRFWWIFALATPFMFVLYLMVSESYRPAMAWIFLASSAALVLLELRWPAEPELRESNSAESGDPLPAGVPDNPWRWLSAPYFVFIPVLFALIFVRGAVFGAATPPETPFLDNPIRGVNWFAGEITALQVLARLWWILLFPKTLSCDYSFNQVPTFGYLSNRWNDTMGILAAMLVIAVFAWAIRLWSRDRKAAAFFMLFFFVAFLPTSNILITIGSIMAERFLYLPMIGFIGAMVLAIEWIVLRAKFALQPDDAPPIAQRVTSPDAPPVPAQLKAMLRPSSLWITPAIILVIATLYSVRTYTRNWAWQSDLTLWTAAKDVSPVSFRSYQSYAFALFEEVQKPVELRQPEAKNVTIDDCIEWIVKGRPIVDQLPDRLNSSRLYLHEGMYSGMKGEQLCLKNADGTMTVTPEAMQWFKKSIDALERGRRVDRAFNEVNRQKEVQRGKKLHEIPDAGLLQIYEYLGLSYSRLGMLDQALDNYVYMRQLEPWNPDSYEKIALIYMQAASAPNISNEDRVRRTEQVCIGLIQELWLDPTRRHLWPALEKQLQSIDTDNIAPTVMGPDGVPRLNVQCQTVRSLLILSYTGLTRIFLQAKQYQNAEFVRAMAVRDLGFPQGLFDDVFKEFGLTPPPIPLRQGAPAGTPAPVTPPPPTQQQPGTPQGQRGG